ncbi:hypothetical protein ACPCSP_25440 [Streptomyces cinereoruber]|uniref:hypothetical protein n=1 Tax=Streptomyces cinereoruber TaxID=67260 RepID=UPI003C2CF1AA
MLDLADLVADSARRIHESAARALADDPDTPGVIVCLTIDTPAGPIELEPWAFARATEASCG